MTASQTEWTVKRAPNGLRRYGRASVREVTGASEDDPSGIAKDKNGWLARLFCWATMSVVAAGAIALIALS